MAKLAVHGGLPVRTRPFPSWPVHDEREVQAVASVANSGQWGFFSGDNLKDFEAAFAEYHGARYGLAVSNGTTGLQVALAAAGVGPGDEVITPALTWVATPAAALYLGATPIFADIDPETYCLDADAVEAAITPRTKAVIPVHLYSCVADMDRFVELAEKHGLALIEDCAHAHGSFWRGRGAGSIGDLGVFSFQETKTMSAGEGGIVLTSDPALEELCHSYLNCGRIRKSDQFDRRVLGWNYRMTEWQAAVLRVQLSRLQAQTERRMEKAAYLDRHLGEIEGIRPMRRDPRVTRQGMYIYTFRYDPAGFEGAPRDKFLVALYKEGVPIDGIYQPVYKSPLFPVTPESCPIPYRFNPAVPDYRALHLPVTERASHEEAVGIPHHVLLGTGEDMDDIVATVAKIQAHAAELHQIDPAQYAELLA